MNKGTATVQLNNGDYRKYENCIGGLYDHTKKLLQIIQEDNAQRLHTYTTLDKIVSIQTNIEFTVVFKKGK